MSMLPRLVAICAVLLVPGFARAELLLGLTVQNSLVTFDSASPGTVGAEVLISGLAADERLVGIDFRPANNQLYGLAVGGPGGSARLFTIDPTTGAATASPALSTALTGGFFGFDFNPVADRLRVTSDTGQNYRINVDTGAVIVDGDLAYAAGDLNAGSVPQVVAVAYTNSNAGAATTTLYDIDANGGLLALQNPPNSGILNTVGFLDGAAALEATFDISGPTGIGYAVLNGVTLVQVNLATGGTQTLGDIAAPSAIIGLAAQVGAVPEPSSLVLAGFGVASLVGYSWRRRTHPQVVSSL